MEAEILENQRGFWCFSEKKGLTFHAFVKSKSDTEFQKYTKVEVLLLLTRSFNSVTNGINIPCITELIKIINFHSQEISIIRLIWEISSKHSGNSVPVILGDVLS